MVNSKWEIHFYYFTVVCDVSCTSGKLTINSGRCLLKKGLAPGTMCLIFIDGTAHKIHNITYNTKIFYKSKTNVFPVMYVPLSFKIRWDLDGPNSKVAIKMTGSNENFILIRVPDNLTREGLNQE